MEELLRLKQSFAANGILRTTLDDTISDGNVQ